MSRIGKMPVLIPAGVSASWEAPRLVVKGPKGELSRAFPPGVAVEVSGNQIVVQRQDDSRENRMKHGMVRSLIQGMVDGVSKGYEIRLEVLGVGYRAEVKGRTLLLYVGFTHPVEFAIPEGITVTVDRAMIAVSGVDKQKVGEVAAEIRAKKPPEPYKGKGIKYAHEIIRRKAGKATVAGGGKQ